MYRSLAAVVLLILSISTEPLRAADRSVTFTAVTVSVYNDARVPQSILDRAEERAVKIFASAGFEVVWLNCQPAAAENTTACHHDDESGHLSLRIIADAPNSLNPVAFGVAFLSPDGAGRYCDVFWKRAEDLHASSNLEIGELLGNVMAHEVGHLLLGSNAHAVSGIMRAHWEGESLRRITMGTLLFTPQQVRIMHVKARLPQDEPRLDQN